VGTQTIITKGLQPGATVIVEGFQKIRPGAPVQPMPWQAGAQGQATGQDQVDAQGHAGGQGQGPGPSNQAPSADDAAE